MDLNNWAEIGRQINDLYQQEKAVSLRISVKPDASPVIYYQASVSGNLAREGNDTASIIDYLRSCRETDHKKECKKALHALIAQHTQIIKDSHGRIEELTESLREVENG